MTHRYPANDLIDHHLARGDHTGGLSRAELGGLRVARRLWLPAASWALDRGSESSGEGAAVDGQQRAVDEGSFVRREEGHNVGDLRGAADATQGG